MPYSQAYLNRRRKIANRRRDVKYFLFVGTVWAVVLLWAFHDIPFIR